jgi:hypothetical protein
MKTYAFDARIQEVPDVNGAFVEVPLDLPSMFGCGRMKVHATFDGEPYEGSVVAFKQPDGSRSYVLGIPKDIRVGIGRQPGDTVHVTLVCAQIDAPAQTFYDAYLAKVLAKGRSREELDEVICWLCGYAPSDLTSEALSRISLAQLIDNAPAPNPAAQLISGKICGYDVSLIQDPTMQAVRQLDKLVDELAKGRPMEKVLRS